MSRERKRNRLLLPVLLLAGLLALAGCKGGALPEGMEEDAVLAAGEEVLSYVVDGEYEQLYQRLRTDVQAGLSAQALQESFQPALDQVGAFEKIDKTLVTSAQDPEPQAIAVFLCDYEKAQLRVRIAFDPDMELIGMEIQEQ